MGLEKRGREEDMFNSWQTFVSNTISNVPLMITNHRLGRKSLFGKYRTDNFKVQTTNGVFV